MDPSSHNENGNVSFRNFQRDLAVESTPKKQKNKNNNIEVGKFVCNVCDKVYQKEFYYNKHVLTHTSQPQQPVNSNENPSASRAFDDTQPLDLSVNDLSFAVSFDQSAGGAAGAAFKVPAAPVPKKTSKSKSTKKPSNAKLKPTMVCTYCLKKYVCTRSYKSHVRLHTLQDAARKIADKEKILDNIEAISSKSLSAVSNCVSHGSAGKKFKELVGHLAIQENFVDFSTAVAKELLVCIDNKKVVLPSALMVNLFDKMEEVLSNNELCQKLLDILSLSDFEPDTQSQFLLEFMLNFTLEIFKFISANYRASCRPRVNTPSYEITLEEKQVIFYIAGSIMRGYLRIAKRHSSNKKWQNIANVLKSQVLCEKPEGDIEAQWTADVDRGGLLYIKTLVQTFFKKVTFVVYSCEQQDGSIDYEEVINKVSNTDSSVDWDNIIRDSLPESVSLNLMNDVITTYCKTCGRGVAKRKLNQLRQKNPLISMATRVSVARRKKK